MFLPERVSIVVLIGSEMFRWSGDPESKFYRPTLDRSPPLRFRSHRNPREEFCHRPHSLWCRGTVISNLKETDEYGIGR